VSSDEALWLSVPPKLKTMEPDWMSVIVVSGASVSIVHVQTVGSSSTFSCSDRSVARTRNSCVPALRPVYVSPEEQATSRSSSQHWNVAGSFALKTNVALVEEVGLLGPEVIVVFGGVRSATVHSNCAGVRSSWPSAFTA
jgi:hypothetical protein